MKPMKDPLGVSPSKGNQGTTRGKETILLTSVGIEPTTSGLDLPLLCRLSYEVGHFRVNSLFHHLCSQCFVAQHLYVALLSLRRDSPPLSSPTFSVRPRSSICSTLIYIPPFLSDKDWELPTSRI